jgi:processive 1,2-diacylglycerol beta-glucosyltransferase
VPPDGRSAPHRRVARRARSSLPPKGLTRVLILTASVGEGHDLPARTLAEQLRTEAPGTEVVIEDGLVAMGRGLKFVNEGGASVFFYRFQWIWDAAFWLSSGFAPTRRAVQALVRALGSRGVRRLVRRVEPDIVVSVYPLTTEVLGGLRRRGRLQVPAVGAITDLAMMHWWAAPGIDLHLVIHPDVIAEVRAIAGQATEIEVVRGLTRPEFSGPCDPVSARSALDLPQAGKIVLVSGGGWGVGDLETAADEALRLDVALVVCLCGRNDALRERLARRYASEPRVRVVGFTEHMSEWMAAADALIHSTGGLTVLEAYVRGCPTISFGWGRGHIRVHNKAFRRFGFADVATTKPELVAALTRALAQRPVPGFALGSLPTAASFVLALVA